MKYGRLKLGDGIHLSRRDANIEEVLDSAVKVSKFINCG